METATKALEELRKQALAPHPRSTTDPDTAPSPSTGTPAEQRYFDAADVQVPSDQIPEMTNPNFEYVPGETGFDEWLAQHASGAEVRTGEGKDVSNTAYGVTVTQYAPKKTT
jgi:flavin-dependent dehydrogenase